MRDGIRTRRGVTTVTLESCPCCKRWARAEIQGGKILGLKHATYDADLECPYIIKANANPMNRFQKIVFDYEGLEERCLVAKEAVRKDNNRDSRLDGRPKYSRQESGELTAEDHAATFADLFA